MQSYREQELIQTVKGLIIDELTTAMPATATHHVIGIIPEVGSEVTINGLVWVVERVNDKVGWMRLRLKKPD